MTVTVAGPVVAELFAVKVSVLVPVVLLGLNDADTPLGKPDDANVTLSVKPPLGFTVIVVGTLLPPWTTSRAFGAADSAKFAPVAVTTSENITGVSPVVEAVIVTFPVLTGVV